MSSATLKLGVIVGFHEEPEPELQKVADLGLPTCQLSSWNPVMYTDENAARLRRACADIGVEITTLWTGYPGPATWNFVDGPATIGFVPPEHRDMRVDALLRGAEFARAIGVPSITTHAGFIPENPCDPLYAGTIDALRRIAAHCKELGLDFCFETGQETPITLLRAMTDIATGNLGVNLDPANLLMYGKANPVDALDILGPYVRGVHAKDGDYPTEPGSLGREKPLGEGRVGFERLIPKLKSFGYAGALTIEREISGDQQIIDIKRAIEILTPLC
ncbi:MAG: TIM barrel protein [Armatimonadota bacterium]|nr:MAG: TIM barrel protein [Armatimonadota bacterium]